MPLSVLGYDFEEPLEEIGDIENKAGLYIVTSRNEDGTFHIIDAGESENLRDSIENQERRECWLKHVSVPTFFVLYTVDVCETDRGKVVKKIHEFYRPECGE